jgi:TRAP-type C4-dicarboxylate transport system substrate-binding protein
MTPTKRIGPATIVYAALLALALGAAWPEPAVAQAVKLTMVGAWAPKVSAAADMGMRFRDEVNRLAGGKLVIEFKGAAEVVPTFDQPEALVRGVFDVWYGAPNYWAGVVPGGYVTELSRFDIPDNGPGSELFELLVKLYAAKGVRYLGHYSGGPGTGNHFMFTQKRVARLADLQRMKVRVPPLTRFFVQAVGAEPVTLPPGEVHIALERGTVEGFTWPIYDGFTNFGWHEVTKFVIQHPLYRNGIGVAMNMAKWNSLPRELQDVVHEAVRRTQRWSKDFVAGHQTAQLATMRKAGMQMIEFTPAEAEHWTKTANEALWAQFKKVMPADDYARARKLLE